MHVARRQRLRQHVTRLVRQEDDVFELEPPRELHQLRVARAGPDDHDRQGSAGRAEGRPRAGACRDPARDRRSPSASRRRSPRDRSSRTSRSVSPAARSPRTSTQFGMTSIRARADAFRLEPCTHRLSDRDDAVSMSRAGTGMSAPSTRTPIGLRSLPSSTAISGNTSWLMTTSGTRKRRAIE